MILQRIIGRRGSGRTTVALSQAYANSPSGRLSLYACRSMDDANRCYRNYVDRWRGATFKRYFVEWQKRNTQGTHYLRFVSPHVYEPIGDDLGDVTIDLPLADVDPRWLDQVMARAQGTLTIIAAEPWARDMRAWQIFLRHCGPFGRTMLLTTCFAPGRSTQAKTPIVYGKPRPFMPRIWLPGTPEVIL